jgi:hypothetical protein
MVTKGKCVYSSDEALAWMIDVACGMKYLHAQQEGKPVVVHRWGAGGLQGRACPWQCCCAAAASCKALCSAQHHLHVMLHQAQFPELALTVQSHAVPSWYPFHQHRHWHQHLRPWPDTPAPPPPPPLPQGPEA